MIGLVGVGRRPHTEASGDRVARQQARRHDRRQTIHDQVVAAPPERALQPFNQPGRNRVAYARGVQVPRKPGGRRLVFGPCLLRYFRRIVPRSRGVPGCGWHGGTGSWAAAVRMASSGEGTLIDGQPLSLWFFLHHPHAFHQVFLNQEIWEEEAWRNAEACPGRVIEDAPGKAVALAASLRDFFQLHAGSGRFCAVALYLLNGAYCFVAHVAARLQLFEGFTEDGTHTRQRLRPSFPVLFVYYPQDGTVLLKAPLSAEDRLLELIQRFGRVVLGADLTAKCLDHAFRLDRLVKSFQPLPDADDMESVRVKTLHFRYPERHGRRQITLETVASDEPLAITRLMQTHMSGEGVLEQVQVCYAELQILLRVEGQIRSYFIHLWTNRCNLNQTPQGKRLRACLKRWGIYE